MQNTLEYFYYPSLWAYLLLALLLNLLSIKKYNYIPLESLGLTVICFEILRMFNQFSCQFTSPYYWNSDLYIIGSYITIVFSLLFLTSSLSVSASYYFRQRKSFIKALSCKSYSNRFIPIFACAINSFGVLFYGKNLAYRFSESNSALSVDGPVGISIYFWLFSGVFIYLSYYLAMKLFSPSSPSNLDTFDLFSILFTILVAFLLGKRGIIIIPLLTFISFSSLMLGFRELVSFISKSFRSIIRELRISRLFFASLLFTVIVLYGIFYIAFKAYNIIDLLGGTSRVFCTFILFGGQEYDQLWPLVLKVFPDFFTLKFFDIPTAFVGQFIDHYFRLVQYSSQFHSITDILMLDSFADVYINQKFGISPSISQFYWAYFGIFSFFIAAFAGYYSRYIFFRFLPLYAKSIPRAHAYLSISVIPLTAFDFTGKYVLVSSFAVYIVFLTTFTFYRYLFRHS